VGMGNPAEETFRTGRKTISLTLHRRQVEFSEFSESARAQFIPRLSVRGLGLGEAASDHVWRCGRAG
jgi:hypothetical protein